MQDRRSTRTPESTVVYVELDGADRLAPHAWDDLMAGAVRRLREQLRRHDAVGRYGDGILALLGGVRADLGEQVARRMLAGIDVREARVEEVAPGERLDGAAARARDSVAARREAA